MRRSVRPRFGWPAVVLALALLALPTLAYAQTPTPTSEPPESIVRACEEQAAALRVPVSAIPGCDMVVPVGPPRTGDGSSNRDQAWWLGLGALVLVALAARLRRGGWAASPQYRADPVEQ